MTRLSNGERFPYLEFETVGGDRIVLPDNLTGSYSVVIGYRGSWCPYCNEQLARFQRNLPKLSEEGILVVAFSADDRQHAEETAEKHGITFPLGFGINGIETAELLGGYVHPRRGSLEPTQFVLNPDSSVAFALYATGAIGRVVPDDALGYVRFLKAAAAKSDPAV
jgi:peroxiredoxin